MKCKHVQKYLIAFLDQALSPEKANYIRDHLKHCSECHSVHDKIAAIWYPGFQTPKIKAKPRMWHNLQTQMNEYDEERNKPEIHHFPRGIRYAATAACFIIGIFIGIFLGSDPQSEGLQNAAQGKATTNNLIKIEAEFTEFIEPLPVSTLEGAYFSLASETQRGR